jgi:hypothetical protein
MALIYLDQKLALFLNYRDRFHGLQAEAGSVSELRPSGNQRDAPPGVFPGGSSLMLLGSRDTPFFVRT